MTMYTYAQNGEDVILQRVFRHIENGFYVDVGAQDPVVDSVTKAFYELGWHGVNIEPASTYLDLLKLDRPRDLNLGVIVSDAAGIASFFRIPDTGLSTTQPHLAEKAAQTHGFAVYPELIPSLTLSQILQSTGPAEIHFLKVDVEGGEKAVLSGLNLKKDRPWVILVEATEPLSTLESFQAWEPLLLNSAYEFVFSDGLNRYYLAMEHPELKESFRSPPNLFDEAVPYALVRIQNHLEAALATEYPLPLHNTLAFYHAFEIQISSIATQHNNLRSELHLCQNERDAALQQISSMKNKLSWKVASPFRESWRAVSKVWRLREPVRKSTSLEVLTKRNSIFGKNGVLGKKLRSLERKNRSFLRRIFGQKSSTEQLAVSDPALVSRKVIGGDSVKASAARTIKSADPKRRCA